MSASLIRRGLELFSDKDGVKRKQKSSSAHKSALMERISTDKQGVQRRIRHLQRPGGAARSTTTVKDKRIRSALDEYRKKQKRSNYGTNLTYFRSNASKTLSSHSTKIVEKNSSRRACHQPDQPVKKTAEKSVFTEEEFQKFQKEYFSNL